MKNHYLLLSAMGALSLAATAKDKDKEKDERSLTLEHLPAKASEAIRKAADGKPVRIEAEKEDGVAAFAAKWQVDGHAHELTLTAEGTVISEEEAIATEASPAAVQAAIKALSAGGKLTGLEKQITKSGTLYEAAFKTGEGKLEVKWDAEGREVSRDLEKKDKHEEKEKAEEGKKHEDHEGGDSHEDHEDHEDGDEGDED